MKILASDFDGTIYFQKEKEHYHQEDIDAILQFQKEGNLFGLCTGRPINGILPFKSEQFDFDFYICNSGAMIYDKNKNCLQENYMDISVLQSVMERYSKGIEIFVIGSDQLVVYHPLNNSNFRDEIHSFEEVKDIQLLGFALHFDTAKQAEETIDSFRQNYPMIDAYVNVDAIDCVPKGCSKATGIKFIQNYFNCELDMISTIGDNYNDIPMLKAVENSYTFYSSPQGVKDQVKYLVHSVAECIKSQL